MLGQDADGGADAGIVASQPKTGDLSGAARRRDERREQADRGRLPRAVRSKEAEDLALAHLEIEGVDGGELLEALGQLFGAEHHAPESRCRARRSGHSDTTRSRSTVRGMKAL